MSAGLLGTAAVLASFGIRALAQDDLPTDPAPRPPVVTGGFGNPGAMPADAPDLGSSDLFPLDPADPASPPGVPAEAMPLDDPAAPATELDNLPDEPQQQLDGFAPQPSAGDAPDPADRMLGPGAEPRPPAPANPGYPDSGFGPPQPQPNRTTPGSSRPEPAPPAGNLPMMAAPRVNVGEIVRNPVRIHEARTLVLMGHWPKATQALDTLAVRYPADPRVEYLRYFLLARSGNRDAALDSLQNAIGLERDNPAYDYDSFLEPLQGPDRYYVERVRRAVAEADAADILEQESNGQPMPGPQPIP